MEFMEIKRDIRKIAELGIGSIAIASLLLVGCGGGGGSSVSTTPAVDGTTITVVPYKGMFKSGAVTLKDGTGATVTLLSGGTIDANGTATVTYPKTVVYPLIVSVTGSYLNEAKGGALEVAGLPIHGFVASSSVAAAATAATTGVPVTAITEMAYAQVASGVAASNPISKINVDTAIANAVAVLGVPNAVPSFDANGGALNGNTAALQGIALSIASKNPTANLATALSATGQALATALVNSSASAVAAVSTNLPSLAAKITTAASNNASTMGSSVVPAGPPAVTPVTVAVGVVAPAAATKIATSTVLLNSLNNGFVKQASGVQADLNSINGPFQEAQNIALFLYQGMTLASNGSLTNTALSRSVTINGYPCVLTSVAGGTGTAICQWANNNVNTGPTIHQLTITGPNVSTGLLNIIPQGTYTWSDTIIQAITLSSVNSLPGQSVPGITAATGTVVGSGTTITLNGDTLPGVGPTSTDSMTHLASLAVAISSDAVAKTITYGMTGTVTEMAGAAAVDSITLSSGSQVVQSSVNYHTVSANLVTQASTQNYRFTGTVVMSNFAQDKLSSTNPNPGWNPGTVSFTGNVTGVGANASLGQILTTTGSGLVVTSDRTQYDPTQAVSGTNFPTESVLLAGNVLTGGATYGISMNLYTGTNGTTYNTVSTVLTYTDSSSNAITVNGSATGLVITGATSVKSTLSGNNTGTVSAGSTLLGNIVNGVVSFTDNSTYSLN